MSGITLQGSRRNPKTLDPVPCYFSQNVSSHSTGDDPSVHEQLGEISKIGTCASELPSFRQNVAEDLAKPHDLKFLLQ